MSEEPSEGRTSVFPRHIRAVAGFWRRVGAFVIDSVLIGLPAYLISLNYAADLIALGQKGRLIGLAVVLVYFGLGDSKWFGGRTPGKAALDIAVVGRDGKGISPVRAMIRVLILSTPSYLNGLYIAPTGNAALDAAIPTALTIGLFGVGGVLLWMFVFNGRTRQSLHDWLTGTFVVPVEARGAPIGLRTSPLHFVMAVAMTCLAFVGFFRLFSLLPATVTADLNLVTPTQERLLADPRVSEAGIQLGTITSTGGSGTYILVRIVVSDPNVSLQEMVRWAASETIKLHPDLLGRGSLTVSATRGYDIGIAGSWETAHDNGTLQYWRNKLFDGTTET